MNADQLFKIIITYHGSYDAFVAHLKVYNKKNFVLTAISPLIRNLQRNGFFETSIIILRIK